MASMNIRALFLLAAITFVSCAETGLNETRPETTSSANTETTTTTSSDMLNASTDASHDTSSMKAEESTSTTSGSTTTSDNTTHMTHEHSYGPVLIGNSQPPTVLEVDTSSQSSSVPSVPSDTTKMFDSSSAATTTWTSSSSSEPSTTSGNEESTKEMVTKPTGVKWEVNTSSSSSEDPKKHEYDVMQGDQAAESDGTKTSSKNMDAPTMGTSQEIGSETQPKASNSQKGNNNGIGRNQQSFHMITASSLLLLFCAYLRV